MAKISAYVAEILRIRAVDRSNCTDLTESEPGTGVSHNHAPDNGPITPPLSKRDWVTEVGS